MKKQLLILLAVVLFTSAQAQVPGYHGKKFLLGYSVQMAPNLHNWIAFSGAVPFRLHPKHFFSAEYIAGRHTIVALEGGFMRYKRTILNESERAEVQLNGGFVGFNVMLFGNNLAPVGNYFSLNIQQNFLNFNDPKGWTDEYLNSNGVPITGKLQSTTAGIGFGTKRVFANSVVADMGLGVGCSFTTFKEGNILMYPNARSFASNLILFRQVLNYKIGISGLLF